MESPKRVELLTSASLVGLPFRNTTMDLGSQNGVYIIYDWEPQPRDDNEWVAREAVTSLGLFPCFEQGCQRDEQPPGIRQAR